MRGEAARRGRSAGAGPLPGLDAEAAPLRIETREALINALQQAVRVEHALMVQYLFAAFSCRRSVEEGLTPPQLTAVRGWQRTLLSIARDEMAHLATVCNMLNAVGGTPSFSPVAFSPSVQRWFPVPFVLEPLGKAALSRFVRFESPQAPLNAAAGIAPPPIEFDYVGQLYRAIRDGFTSLASSRRVRLFVGRPGVQDEDDWTGGLRIQPVRDLASAQAAVDFIIAQGEGSPDAPAASHFASFGRMAQELAQLSDADPAFSPARPVATNPVTRLGSAPQQTLLPAGTTARAVGELFNHLYESVLLLLATFFDPAGESASQRAIVQATARRLMSGAIRPLAEELTLLPVTGTDGLCAGAPFEVYGDLRLPSAPDIRWQLVGERFELARNYARRLADEQRELVRCRFVAESLDYLVDSWAQAMRAEST